MVYLRIIAEIVGLVGLSAIFSGLNIAFMSLPRRDLRHLAKLGNRDAIRVLPFRENPHLTLAAILYANVAAVTTTGIVLESYTGGIIAGFISTILLVIFGEILPQAYFSRTALKACSVLAPVLRLTVIITYPFSKPTQLLLDKVLPRSERPLRSRGELGLLIHEYKGSDHPELDDDEVEIIQGALSLSEKQVSEIMTPLDKVFWLTTNAMIDRALIEEIKAKDYSRIPVFDDTGSDFRGVLLMKDMIDIDFAANPWRVADFPLRHGESVGSRTALDTMFRKFLSSPSHLVAVEKDDKIVGILTVEDLIEEIVGHEIVDESDRDHGRR